MTDSTPPEPRPEILDPTSTSVPARRWCADEVTKLRDLLVHANGMSMLPPELAKLALDQMAGGDVWPRWLVLGIGMRLARMWLEKQLRPVVVEEEIAPAPAKKRARKRS